MDNLKSFEEVFPDSLNSIDRIDYLNLPISDIKNMLNKELTGTLDADLVKMHIFHDATLTKSEKLDKWNKWVKWATWKINQNKKDSLENGNTMSSPDITRNSGIESREIWKKLEEEDIIRGIEKKLDNFSPIHDIKLNVKDFSKREISIIENANYIIRDQWEQNISNKALKYKIIIHSIPILCSIITIINSILFTSIPLNVISISLTCVLIIFYSVFFIDIKYYTIENAINKTPDPDFIHINNLSLPMSGKYEKRFY